MTRDPRPRAVVASSCSPLAVARSSGMDPLTPEQLRQLPVDERLALLEALWQSLDCDATFLPDEAHQALLDTRLDHPDPRPGVAWSELRDSLRSS